MHRSPQYGVLLGGSALVRALEEEQVFVKGSWSQGAIRAAAYDFRLSSDRMIVPGDEPGSPVLVYGPGKHRTRDVILRPGDTAFVSSQERACFSWGMSGIVGSKFRLSSKGLLLLSGISMDPGYGLQRIAGSWVPMEDQRTHFLFANVGAEPISLRPGDAIAVLNLFSVEPVAEKDRSEVVSPGLETFNEQYFGDRDSQSVGLVFFRNVRDVGQRADAALLAAEDVRNTSRDLLAQIRTVQEGSAFVVTFGIYLVCVTLLGVAITIALNILASAPVDPKPIWIVGAAISGGLLVLSVFAGILLAIAQFRRIGNRDQRPSRSTKTTQKSNSTSSSN